jgi:hypothetical protein
MEGRYTEPIVLDGMGGTFPDSSDANGQGAVTVEFEGSIRINPLPE